jgi:hypothetical protein
LHQLQQWRNRGRHQGYDNRPHAERSDRHARDRFFGCTRNRHGHVGDGDFRDWYGRDRHFGNLRGRFDANTRYKHADANTLADAHAHCVTEPDTSAEPDSDRRRFQRGVDQ